MTCHHLLRRIAALLVASLLSGLVVPAASAATRHYDFTVNWSFGQLAGQSSSGWFEFDSARAQPDAQLLDTRLFTDAEFSVRGVSYAPPQLSSAWLFFDHAGALQEFTLGTECLAGRCSSRLGVPSSLYVTWRRDPSDPTTGFLASVGDIGGGASGAHTGTLSLASAVDEPGSLPALVVGLLMLMAVRARRTRLASRAPVMV
jgi:hypothetical protein